MAAKKTLALNENYGLYEQDKAAWISSVQVAEIFGKQHKNVLAAIKKLPENGMPIEFNGLNFKPVNYKDAKGERRPMYLMTRDGFSLLAMGFTGEKAMQFKIAWLERFNAMEKFIKSMYSARNEYQTLTLAIHEMMGQSQSYLYANEINLLYKVGLGFTAKEYREAHSLPKGASIRPYLDETQIEIVNWLQRKDIGLIYKMPEDYTGRRLVLRGYFLEVVAPKLKLVPEQLRICAAAV